MAGFRHSNAPSANDKLTRQHSPLRSIEAEARKLSGNETVDGTLLLVGGCDLTHFRLRVAQSHFRADMAPSFWSHVGILREDESGFGLYEVALDPPTGFQEMPKRNGVQRVSVSRYEDGTQFPNIALLRFPIPGLRKKPAGQSTRQAPRTSPITEGIDRVRAERGVLDIPTLILPWLGFVWGAGMPPNPLIGGTGIPGAVFAESAFAAVGVELTPGLSTRSSCPEAIWQAALWWYPYYDDQAPKGESTGNRPIGAYWIGQPEAAYVEKPGTGTAAPSKTK
jgi:hypothetical protein